MCPRMKLDFLLSPFKLALLLAVCGIGGAGFDRMARGTENKGEARPTVTNLKAEEAVQLVGKEKTLIIVDVRTPEEFQEGHLTRARNVDFNGIDFSGSLAHNLRAFERGSPVLVYCRSGRRSTASLKVFKNLGIRQIYHLDGGIKAWSEAGGDILR